MLALIGQNLMLTGEGDAMKLLMFGKTGQVATALQACCPPGWHLIALDRAAADLADPEACAALIAGADADVVINAAAYTAVDRAEEQEALARRINGDAPGAMARAAARKGIGLVHLSTDYVFDGSGTRGWQPEDPVAPLNAYGRSKALGEVRVMAAGGPGTVVIRVSSVFSATGGNFVRTMLRLAETRDQVQVVADQVSGPTAAKDVARMILTLLPMLSSAAKPPFIAHYAGRPDVSWAGFAREIFRQAGHDVEVEEIPSVAWPTPARRPLNARLDCSLLAARFGIPRPDWRDGLAETLADLGIQPGRSGTAG